MLIPGRLFLEIDGGILHVEAVEREEHGCVLYLPDAEWLVFRSKEEAGHCAYDRMRDLAETDPEGFTDLVGPETLARWALGLPAGPGTRRFTSLEEYLESWRTTCSWLLDLDGEEHVVTACSPALARDIGFTPGIAYCRSMGFNPRPPVQRVKRFLREVCCRWGNAARSGGRV